MGGAPPTERLEVRAVCRRVLGEIRESNHACATASCSAASTAFRRSLRHERIITVIDLVCQHNCGLTLNIILTIMLTALSEPTQQTSELNEARRRADMMQTDPFRDLETLFSRVGGRQPNSSGVMPMDAFRRGSDVWVHIDLPGVKAENLDITVERNVLTIAAERNWQRQDGDQSYFGERYRGSFRRQIQLGDGLDLENLEADLHDGVLTIRIPVAEQAKPRKVEVGKGRSSTSEAIEATTTDAN